MAKTWYVRDRGRVMGPLSDEQLLDMRDRGQIQSYHEVSTDKRNWRAFDIVFQTASEPVRPASKNGSARPMRGSRPTPVAGARGNRTYMLVIGGVVAALLVCAAGVGGFLLIKGRAGNDEGGGIPEGPITLTQSTSDTDRGRTINGTIGLIITGCERTTREGEKGEIPLFIGVENKKRQASMGTGFLVSSSGYLLTNYHVVENYDKYRNSKTLADVRSVLSHVDPKIWVFFGVESKHEATLIYTSPKYDLAILNIGGTHPRFFALGYTETGTIPQYSKVFAFGYPSDDQRAIREMKDVTQRKLPPDSKIERFFDKEDFVYTPTNGGVKRNLNNLDPFNKGEAHYLNHEAHTVQGNSGGPLVAWDGTVIGINTFIRSTEIKAGSEVIQINDHGQNFALTMKQLRDEIDKNTDKKVTWRRLPN